MLYEIKHKNYTNYYLKISTKCKLKKNTSLKNNTMLLEDEIRIEFKNNFRIRSSVIAELKFYVKSL